MNSKISFIYITFFSILFICGCSTISDMNINKIQFINDSSKYIFILNSSNSWKSIQKIYSPPETFNADSTIDSSILNYKIENLGTYDSSIEIWGAQEENVFEKGLPLLKTKISALKNIESSIIDDYIKTLHRQEFFFIGIKADSGNIKLTISFSLTGNYHSK